MSEQTSRSLSPTPLHARTAELCGTNRWTSSGGFSVPLVYGSQQEELDAVGTRVGVADLSARQCVQFDGPDAGAYLSFVTTADVSVLENGQTTRVLWCDDEGQVRGDGLVVRYGPALFELSSNVRDFSWFADGALGYDVKVTNVTGQRASIGVRGPLAMNLLSAAGFWSAQPASSGGPALPAPSWRQAQVALIRDGSGGGFELWSHADDGIVLWDRLFRVGSSLGISPVGGAALETLRLEAGLPMAGTDWVPSQLALSEDDLRLPQDLGFAFEAPRRFNGSMAAMRRNSGNLFKLVQFTSGGPCAPGPIVLKSVAVGKFTSCGWSPEREKGFALGWLRKDVAMAGTTFQTSSGVAVQMVKACYL